jgi:ABC-type multidrug transport system permease subunit
MPEARMTSKTIALKILDLIFIGVTMVLMLAIAGVPMGWLLDLVEMSLREFQAFGLFLVFATLLLIHAIATSNSAP